MIHAPKPLLLPLPILTLKPRQPKHLLPLRILRIPTQLALRHLSIPPLLHLPPHVLWQHLPQYLEKPTFTVRLRDFGVGNLLAPEGGVEGVERGGDVGWVLGVQEGECAIGLDHVDGEAGRGGCAHGDAEEFGPAQAFAVDPFVFALRLVRVGEGFRVRGGKEKWKGGVLP